MKFWRKFWTTRQKKQPFVAKFRTSHMSTEYHDHSGRPKVDNTEENIKKISQINSDDRKI